MAWENQLGDSLTHKKWHTVAATQSIPYFNFAIADAEGATLTDVEGKKYIDLMDSAAAVNIGHKNPKVIAAMKEQMNHFVAYDASYFVNPVSEHLAERLAKMAPGKGRGKMAYGASGSDASEAMIKFARAYTGRSYVVAFDGAYHGTTYGTLSASSCDPEMVAKIGPLVPGFVHVPFPNAYRDKLPGESDHDFSQRYFKIFKEPFEHYLPVDETALVMMEPIQGDAGIIKPPKEYVQLVANFCHQHGILLGVDEINQGLGRTGKFWSYQHFDVEPDLLATGKSLASGLPLSAVLGRAEILDSLGMSAYVFTGAGNPVICAAANATLDVIKDEGLVEKSAEDGKYAKKLADQLAENHQMVGDVRMYGLNGGIELVKDRKTKEKDEKAAGQIIYRTFQKGVVMVKLAGNVLRFQPPLVISRSQLDQAFTIIDEAMTDYEQGKIKMPAELVHTGW